MIRDIISSTVLMRLKKLFNYVNDAYVNDSNYVNDASRRQHRGQPYPGTPYRPGEGGRKSISNLYGDFQRN